MQHSTCCMLCISILSMYKDPVAYWKGTQGTQCGGPHMSINELSLLSNSALPQSRQIQILPKSAKQWNATHPAPTHTNASAQKIWADAWPSAFQQTSTTIKPHQPVLFHRPFSWLTVEPCILPIRTQISVNLSQISESWFNTVTLSAHSQLITDTIIYLPVTAGSFSSSYAEHAKWHYSKTISFLYWKSHLTKKLSL